MALSNINQQGMKYDSIYAQVYKQIDTMKKSILEKEVMLRDRDNLVQTLKESMEEANKRNQKQKDEIDHLKKNVKTNEGRMKEYSERFIIEIRFEFLTNAVKGLGDNIKKLREQQVQYAETNELYEIDKQNKLKRIEGLKNDIENFKVKLKKEAEDKIAKIETEKVKSDRENESQAIELKAKGETLNKLYEETLAHKVIMEKITSEKKNIEAKLADAEKMIEKDKLTIDDYSSKLASFQDKIDSNEKFIETLKNSLKEKQDAENELKSVIGNMEKSALELNQTLETTKLDLEKSHQEIVELKEMHTTENAEMQKKFDEEKSKLLEDFANESKAQLCVSEKQKSELEKVINTLTAKLEEEKKNNVEALEKLKREFSTQNVLLETNLNVDFETRLAAVNAEKDEIQTRLTDYEYKYSSLEQTTNSMKIQNKGHEEKFKQQLVQMGKLNERVAKIGEENKTLKEKLAEYEEIQMQKDNIEYELSNLKEEIDLKCKELETANETIDELKLKLADSRSTGANNKKQTTALKRQNSNKTASISKNAKHVSVAEISSSGSNGEIPCHQKPPKSILYNNNNKENISSNMESLISQISPTASSSDEFDFFLKPTPPPFATQRPLATRNPIAIEIDDLTPPKINDPTPPTITKKNSLELKTQTQKDDDIIKIYDNAISMIKFKGPPRTTRREATQSQSKKATTSKAKAGDGEIERTQKSKAKAKKIDDNYFFDITDF